MRVGAVGLARQSHKLKVSGSSPEPADSVYKLPPRGHYRVMLKTYTLCSYFMRSTINANAT